MRRSLPFCTTTGPIVRSRVSTGFNFDIGYEIVGSTGSLRYKDLAGLADRVSGNVKPVKEGHGILWAETDR